MTWSWNEEQLLGIRVMEICLESVRKNYLELELGNHLEFDLRKDYSEFGSVTIT